MASAIVAAPARVAAVLASAHTWTSARRKIDDKPFFFVPGSTAGAVYMTAEDGCTCPAAQKSRDGNCKHQVAVRQYRARQQQPAPAPRKTYEDLYPACAGGCGDVVEKKGQRCYACASDQARRLDQIAKREAVAA